jgi:thiol-disulfide isomerase/thioredoxin
MTGSAFFSRGGSLLKRRDSLRRWIPFRWTLGIVIGAFFLAGCRAAEKPYSGTLPAGKDGFAITIYLFWGEGCPHCAAAKPVLESIARENPLVELRAYEVWYDKGNQALFKAMAQRAGFDARYVPTIFLGSRYWVGFNGQTEQEIKDTIAACRTDYCPDPGAGIVSPSSAEKNTILPTLPSPSNSPIPTIHYP